MAAASTPDAASRRAIIVAHYDPRGGFDPHVVHAIRQYRGHASRIVLASNGGRSLPSELSGLIDTYLPRPNVGYDFGAWRDGLASIDRTAFDEVICVNDSVYGPLFDLAPALASRRTSDADLWGMVVSEQPSSRHLPRQPHVQSWFFAMRRPLLAAPWFERFWSSVEPMPTKRDVIDRYEIGLSQSAIEAGFSIAGLYDARTSGRVAVREVMPHVSLMKPLRSWRLFKKSRRTPHNPSELVWWRLLAAGIPYVKVGLFRVNHYGIDLDRVLDALREKTPYDLGLIHRHLARCG